MSRLEEAEKAVSQLSPDEWKQVFGWLSKRLPAPRSAQELAGELDRKIGAGLADPLKYLDLSQFSDSGRQKAEGLRGTRGR